MAQLVGVRKGAVVVCERCVVADRVFPRLRGLLGRSSLPAGEGLLLTPERSIHMWFMRFPIDALFLDADLTVLGVRESLKPWRMASWRGARAVLELPEGTSLRFGIKPGDRLSLSEAGDEHAKVMLLVDHGGPDRVMVNGRGPLSAAARTADALSDLDLPIGVVVLPDEQPSPGPAA